MTPTGSEPVGVDATDVAAVRAQLGREPRGLRAIAHRCSCGLPDVVATAPELPDGTPFPTTFYLTCPRLVSAVSTLEAAGVMRSMQARLGTDPDLARRYAAAHLDYLQRRAELGNADRLGDVSAGGMPDRVKCLHALVAHALAAGSGVNPLGDEAVDMVSDQMSDSVSDRASNKAQSTRCVAVSTRMAAIDCGTNSIRLLIADVELDADGAHLVDVDRRMKIVRLGQGVDRTKRLDDAALSRAFTAVDEFAALINGAAVQHVRFAATSATRDASNSDVFVAGVRQRLGIEPEVLSGLDEARLTFTGARAGLPALTPPSLVVDIGGGSTEFVMGGREPEHAMSVDVGCVRMAERHFHHDPPLPAEVRAARDDIDHAIRMVAQTVPLRQAGTLVGVAGTVTTVAALARGLDRYDAAAIHASVIDAADVHRITEELLYLTREQRAALPVMHPGRVDVISAGALVLSAIVAYTGVASIVASEHDILDGLVLSMVQAAGS